MSAYGPKRTSLVAANMSAFGGKADMTVCGSPLSRSLLGVKRTCRFALHMSAYDLKRTLLAFCLSDYRDHRKCRSECHKRHRSNKEVWRTIVTRYLICKLKHPTA